MSADGQSNNPEFRKLDNQNTDFTRSLHYDRRLYSQDIAGSLAHVSMLGKQGIISLEEATKIQSGLESILKEIEDATFPWRNELEDIHMNIERRLFDKIGTLAGKLHTARSRNDQVALDLRMYVKESCEGIEERLEVLQETLLELAETHLETIIPGYTHLQRAQPVLLSHHFLAYFEMFQRDKVRYMRVRDSADVMPLGSGALAGLPYPIDRTYVAAKLDFSSISENSMDAVSARDFLLEFHSATATCAVHISRLAEDLILWSTEEFGFIRLGEEFTTGSSIMPQKRNPDFAELARGKTGRIFGNLLSLLTVLKGLPLTYNRDLQEDKEGFFDSDDTIVAILDMLPGMLTSLQVNVENTRLATEEGLLLATDVADYLVGKGLTFRESHAIVSKLTDYLILKQKIFSDLTLNEYKQFSEVFDEDVLAITAQTSIEDRQTYGGTATSMVSDAIARAHQRLKNPKLD